MSEVTHITIDFDADELIKIAKAMKRLDLMMSEFIELAIKKAVEE